MIIFKRGAFISELHWPLLQQLFIWRALKRQQPGEVIQFQSVTYGQRLRQRGEERQAGNNICAPVTALQTIRPLCMAGQEVSGHLPGDPTYQTALPAYLKI